MAWNRAGTISVVNGSQVVNGAGTSWIAGAKVGEALKAPDGQLYEIANISSDVLLTLATPYLGATAAGQTYVIVPTQSYMRDLANQAATLINQFADVVNGAGAGKFAAGGLTAPSIRGIADNDTGVNMPGADILQLVAGGLAQLAFDGNGGVSGKANLFMPRDTIGMTDTNFDNLEPGLRVYYPGNNAGAVNPPFAGGYGHLLSFGAAGGPNAWQLAGPDGRNGPLRMRTRWGGNAWTSWTNLVEDSAGDLTVTNILRAPRVLAGFGSFDNPAIMAGAGNYGFFVESGNLKMRVQNAVTAFSEAGVMQFAQNAFSYYPPNTNYGGALVVGGLAGINSGGMGVSKIQPTNANLHVDSGSSGANGNGAIYLNFYNGKDGTKFGDGASNVVASIRQNGDMYLSSVYPNSDNTGVIGHPTNRWAGAYFATNPTVSSDERIKLDQQPSYGLDFICALTPKSYRLKDAKPVTEDVVTFEEQVLPVMETVKTTKTEVQLVDGVPVLKTIEVEEQRQVIDQVVVVDAAGKPVMVTVPAEYKTIAAVYETVPEQRDADGVVAVPATVRMVSAERQELVSPERQEPMLHPVPRTERRQVEKRTPTVTSVGEGVRRHHGLLAQQVLSVLEDMGNTGTDFAGLIRDEDSDTWGLRYEQFIAPLIQSVQELHEKVRGLEAAR